MKISKEVAREDGTKYRHIDTDSEEYKKSAAELYERVRQLQQASEDLAAAYENFLWKRDHPEQVSDPVVP